MRLALRALACLGALSALGTSTSTALAQAARPAGSAATPAPAGPVSVSRLRLGTMKTSLGYGIVLNKESSLDREAVVLNDGRVPARLADTTYVVTDYQERGYWYNGIVALTPSEPLTAVEIRLLAFDVFGDRTSVLSMTEVADMPAGVTKAFGPKWRIWSENAASEHYATIAYVARVRTATGRVVTTDPAAVLQEARRFSKKLTEADLEPAPARQPGQ